MGLVSDNMGKGSGSDKRLPMSRSCPKRYTGKHGNWAVIPSRPSYCACMWSPQCCWAHWAQLMKSLDDETLKRLGKLGDLFV